VSTIETALGPIIEGKEILELACGTGLWTQRLASTGARILAVDASPEVILINKERLRSTRVEYCVADIFSWIPAMTFDVVFFSFWLSHIPPARFHEFWATVRSVLRPDGTAFFIDSLLEPTSTARDHDTPNNSGLVRRRLNDGREFVIVKVFYDPAMLEDRLSKRNWRGWVRSTGKFFLYGLMMPRPDDR
jgi:demethylmenaquinone methyltransferase/2-methoxy-6-polyprenyl-1,4-benzoquinol methylase